MTETTGGRDRRTTDVSHESTWGATEAAKQEWADAHPAPAEEEQLPAPSQSQPGPTYKNPNAA